MIKRCLNAGFILFILLLASLFSASISLSAAPSDSWKIETVENGLDPAVPISMALDSNNNPHAVYCNPNSSRAIKYVHYNGAVWNITTLPERGGIYLSLTLDKQENPHIAYEGSYTICYASLSDDEWDIIDLDPTHNSDSMFPSLALDSSGNPHISYVLLGKTCSVEYATFKENGWSIETLAKENLVYSTSITLDFENHPHIVYMVSDYSTDYLKYRWFDGESWYEETIDSAPHPSLEFDSMALDVKGNPHICYENREYNANFTDITKVDLKYAWFDGESWHKERIFSGLSGSLALDSKGRPRIAYSDFDSFNLEYAWFDGESWHKETVYNNQVGGGVSMALDNNNRAHIFFIDNYSLKYAVEEGQPYSERIPETFQSPAILYSLVIGAVAGIFISTWYLKKRRPANLHKEENEVKPNNETEQP